MSAITDHPARRPARLVDDPARRNGEVAADPGRASELVPPEA